MSQIPSIGLGTWKMHPEETFEAILHAVRIGYRHIDCASSYGNEREIGNALRQLIHEGCVSRQDLWISSKLANTAHASEDVLPAIEKSMQDLGVNYLDACLMHWPVALRKGVWIPRKAEHLVSLEEQPLEETWAAMEKLVDNGLVRHLGVCNFSIRKLEILMDSARMPPEYNQIELHPYLQQKDMLDFCRLNGIHLIAYSPLGSSDRPKPLKHKDEPVFLEDPVILSVAQENGISASQVVLTWAIQRGTAVIPKSVNRAHLQTNLDADWLKLRDDQMDRIDTLDRHYRYVDGSFWVLPNGAYSLSNLWDE